MEPYQKFTWENIVKQAVARRKELGFTQKRLSLVAQVSTPTISRFENNDRDIKVSSALAILKTLGLGE